MQIGDTGPAGGIIFYIDETVPPKLYYEAWTADEVVKYQFKTSSTAGGGSGTAIGTGHSNTYTDVGDDPEYPAFKVAIDATHGGYTDWFLPSKDELEQLYIQRAVVGGFTTSYYWSSSESGSNRGQIQYFFNGNQSTFDKTVPSWVRVVRAFHVPPEIIALSADFNTTESLSATFTTAENFTLNIN